MYRNNGVKPIHPGPCVSIVSHGTCAIVQPLITAARTKGSSILRILFPIRILHRCRRLRKRCERLNKSIRAFLHARLRRFHFPLRSEDPSFPLFSFPSLSLSLSPFSPSIPINVNNAKRNEDDTSASIVEKGSTGYAYAEN